MGITLEEYNRLIKSIAENKLYKIDNVNFKLTSDSNGYYIEFIGTYDVLGKILINKDYNIISSVYGEYIKDGNINNKDAKSLIGVWTGYSWLCNTIDDVKNPKGIYSKIMLGRLKEYNKRIIRIDTKCFIPGNEHKYDFIIFL